jgi:hypothetical protein
MFCSTCAVHRQSVRPEDGTRRVKLTGTYDFRWPMGSTIRVAFQPHASADVLQTARELVIAAFEKWGVSTAIRGEGVQLAYRVVDDLPLPAVDDAPRRGEAKEEYLTARDKRVEAGAAVAEEDAQLTRFEARLGQARGAALTPDPNASDRQAFAYDVLISVAALPLLLRQTEPDNRGPTLVEFPQSQLGTYARREDFGVPTLYIGRPPAFSSGSDLDWLNSLEGGFTIVHELGHVLGLAHEHQNPHRNLRWKPKEEIEAIIRTRNGGMAPVVSAFIANEITTPWDGEDFSEWRDVTNPSEPVDSVMSKPIYLCLLAGGHDCQGNSVCEVEQRGYEALQKPTGSDLAQLRKMYGSAHR